MRIRAFVLFCAVSFPAFAEEPTLWTNGCQYTLSHLKPGITRAELSKWVEQDGGVFTPFKQERYVLNACTIEHQLNTPETFDVMKLKIDLKPDLPNGYEGPVVTRPTDIVTTVSVAYAEPGGSPHFTISSQCRENTAKIKVGLTRRQVEALAASEGGLRLTFQDEGYFVLACDEPQNQNLGPLRAKTGDLGVLLRLNYRPASLSPEVYALGKWVPPAESPDDVIVSVSKAYLAPRYSE